MLFRFIAYFLFLVLPCTVSAAITGVVKNPKFAKTPTPAFHIPYSKCAGLAGTHSLTSPATGAKLYSKLKTNVWLAGYSLSCTTTGGTTGCGGCFQAHNSNGALAVWFYIADYHCNILEISQGAYDRLNTVSGGNFNSATGLVSVAVSNCVA
ncbi:hypothetical protein TWF225_005751 [Orbilia oligospora]|uniref:Uncharacterized protein n=1 Tax=Orbilia oligospora TaxID=2813651 RepID=A0A7C8KTE0_ORBOL|nr:hypothetical protein TWF751_005174 [Orbilia oligospora]KAF3184840.1 hypothetical protein TWF225_005751 [Orbilia oligospora]KAF3271325.1 hypothetical protein TWF217_005723 [Orbilia oligospora]KAF3271883.1 hypothetical protein TWF128_000409 [Orbilia oligospora]KAF3293538.1 hypothetical protein TWF132_004506 [Orbilia oligospora]